MSTHETDKQRQEGGISQQGPTLPPKVEVLDKGITLLPNVEADPIEVAPGTIERITLNNFDFKSGEYLDFIPRGGEKPLSIMPIAVVRAGSKAEGTDYIIVTSRRNVGDESIEPSNVFGVLTPMQEGGYDFNAVPRTYTGDMKFMNLGRDFKDGQLVDDRDNPGDFRMTTSSLHFGLGATEFSVLIRGFNPTNQTLIWAAEGHPAMENLRRRVDEVAPHIGGRALSGAQG